MTTPSGPIDRTGNSPASLDYSLWNISSASPPAAFNCFKVDREPTLKHDFGNLTQKTPISANTISFRVALNPGQDYLGLQLATSASLVAATGGGGAPMAFAMRTPEPASPEPDAPAAFSVVAHVRQHRGAPNLPLIQPNDPGPPRTFRLKSQGSIEPEISVDAEVDVLSSERLRFDIDAIPLEGNLRDLDLIVTEANGERTTVPVNIHVCSDTIVLVDGSARMLELSVGGCCGSKWTSALEAVNLFAALSALAVPDLAKATPDLPEPNRLAIGTYFADGEDHLVVTPLEPASCAPALECDVPEPCRETSLGAALERAAGLFPPSRLRRRHLVVITSGLGEADAAAFDEHTSRVPAPDADDTRGVHVHVIAFGRPGEVEDSRLARLATSHGGRYFNTASAADATASTALVPPLAAILQDLLPVEVTVAATPRAMLVDESASRVLFVGRRPAEAAPLIVENTNVRARARRERDGSAYSFADTNLAVPGAWHILPGVTEFDVRADGETELGTPFSRSAEMTLLRQAIPDAGGSFVWFERRHHGVGTTMWLATFVPKVALLGGVGEMGPGLSREIGLADGPLGAPGTKKIDVRDNWDGTYSAAVTTQTDSSPDLFVTYRDPETGALAAVPLLGAPGTTRRVTVTLVGVQYDDATECSPPTSATVVTAPNVSFPRSTRHDIDLSGLQPGARLSMNEVVLDRFVEDGACLLLALGDPGLDFFGTVEEPGGADHRIISLTEGIQSLAPAAEDAYARWRAWYRVEVGQLRSSVAPAAPSTGRHRDSA